MNKGKLFKSQDKLLKQNNLTNDDKQFFPSIPNWENSYGYRFDS